MRARGRKGYFAPGPGAPPPLEVEVRRRIRFSDTDPMAIMWHGRYPLLFEEAAEELGRRIGLSYAEYFEAGLRAPIVALHVDYFHPLLLDEEVTVRASLCWHDGARLNTEYRIFKPDGTLATSGYTVQLLTAHDSGLPCLVVPELLRRCQERWLAGELPRRP
ncbi:MAG: acyl-CoA thioesterase [Deltaproteobacteria bacterium]|nr:MAG: acyl-CoA thioesterase [Deltaproteobacteria bacterium]